MWRQIASLSDGGDVMFGLGTSELTECISVFHDNAHARHLAYELWHALFHASSYLFDLYNSLQELILAANSFLHLSLDGSVVNNWLVVGNAEKNSFRNLSRRHSCK